MGNLGKWDRWYADLDEPQPYGDTVTYQIGADWLAGCSLVEDWGCGKGWMRRLIPDDRYRGVDGSRTPFADVIADLAVYRSDVAGVFIRHVLEHNYGWKKVLDGALMSARERLCLVLFTPLADQTGEIAFAADPGVPDIAFRLDDLTTRIEIAGFCWTVETLPTATQYGVETVLRCER